MRLNKKQKKATLETMYTPSNGIILYNRGEMGMLDCKTDMVRSELRRSCSPKMKKISSFFISIFFMSIFMYNANMLNGHIYIYIFEKKIKI